MIRLLLAALVLLAVPPASAQTIDILAFGDSLTAGLGLDPAQSFPSRLESALKARGHDVRVINAGVSGDTASAARSRLDWALTEDIDAVIVTLGGNDALRGQDPRQTAEALDGILKSLKDKELPVLLAGMRAPRNLGSAYAAQFDALFPALAAKHGVPLYPFFLEGVAADPRLNQPDGIHPNAGGVDAIVNRILPDIEALIAKTASK